MGVGHARFLEEFALGHSRERGNPECSVEKPEFSRGLPSAGGTFFRWNDVTNLVSSATTADVDTSAVGKAAVVAGEEVNERGNF